MLWQLKSWNPHTLKTEVCGGKRDGVTFIVVLPPFKTDLPGLSLRSHQSRSCLREISGQCPMSILQKFCMNSIETCDQPQTGYKGLPQNNNRNTGNRYGDFPTQCSPRDPQLCQTFKGQKQILLWGFGWTPLELELISLLFPRLLWSQMFFRQMQEGKGPKVYTSRVIARDSCKPHWQEVMPREEHTEKILKNAKDGISKEKALTNHYLILKVRQWFAQWLA